MREFTAADIRNLIGVLTYLDREDLEPVMGHASFVVWARLKEKPFDGFMKLGDQRQEQIAALINSKLGA